MERGQWSSGLAANEVRYLVPVTGSDWEAISDAVVGRPRSELTEIDNDVDALFVNLAHFLLKVYPSMINIQRPVPCWEALTLFAVVDRVDFAVRELVQECNLIGRAGRGEYLVGAESDFKCRMDQVWLTSETRQKTYLPTDSQRLLHQTRPEIHASATPSLSKSGLLTA